MNGPQVHRLDVPYAAHAGETHRITYYSWGDASAPPVLCMHGLARNARDFDFLAEALSARHYVIAVDMPGRGKSEWLKYKEEYNLVSYSTYTLFLLRALGISRVDWVGTSMGGMLGMLLAGQFPGMVRRMVMNDVGAFIPAAALARIGAYVGKRMQFASRAEAEAALRKIYAPFGIREEYIWQHMFKHNLEDMPDGTARLTYDPAIGAALNADPNQPDMDLSALWEKVQCPVLLIRGGESDILTAATAERMRQSHPALTLHTVPSAGHAPTLMDTTEIKLIGEWLGS